MWNRLLLGVWWPLHFASDVALSGSVDLLARRMWDLLGFFLEVRNPFSGRSCVSANTKPWHLPWTLVRVPTQIEEALNAHGTGLSAANITNTGSRKISCVWQNITAMIQRSASLTCFSSSLLVWRIDRVRSVADMHLCVHETGAEAEAVVPVREKGSHGNSL